MAEAQNQATMIETASKKTGLSEADIKEGFNSLSRFVSQSSENFGRALDSYNKTMDFMKEKEITSREIAKYESMERVTITQIQEKYSLMRDVFGALFAERRAAINKDFEVIDKGIRENDYSLIAKGLDALSQVVTTSPFADIVSFHKTLELDDGVIEL